MHDSFKALLPMIIPEGVSDYFALSGHKKDTTGIHIYLEELNAIPVEYQNSKLLSKGFFDEVVLQDFPIRGQEVYLHVKRRRWLNGIAVRCFRFSKVNFSGYIEPMIFLCTPVPALKYTLSNLVSFSTASSKIGFIQNKDS